MNQRFAARGVAGILSVAVGAALLQLAPAAVADPAPVGAGDQVVEAAQVHEAGVPSTAAALVDAASPVGSVDLTKTGGGFVAQDPDGSSVEIDKHGEATLSAPGVPDIGISVAGAEGRSVMAAGAAVWPDALPSTDVVTRATGDGVQIVAVLNDENAPDSISFPVDLPEGGRLVAQPDGGVLVQAPVQVETVPEAEANRVLAAIEAITGDLDADGELTEAQIAQLEDIPAAQTVTETQIQTVAEIKPAWAKDANDAPVETRYEIDGDTVKQVVDTENAAFPITADPNWAWWTWTTAACGAEIAALSVGGLKVVQAFAKSERIIRASSKALNAYKQLGNSVKKVMDKLWTYIKDRKRLSAAQVTALRDLFKAVGTTLGNILGVGSCIEIARQLF